MKEICGKEVTQMRVSCPVCEEQAQHADTIQAVEGQIAVCERCGAALIYGGWFELKAGMFENLTYRSKAIIHREQQRIRHLARLEEQEAHERR